MPWPASAFPTRLTFAKFMLSLCLRSFLTDSPAKSSLEGHDFAGLRDKPQFQPKFNARPVFEIPSLTLQELQFAEGNCEIVHSHRTWMLRSQIDGGREAV